MAKYFTDVEIDDILVSVDNAIKNSSTLAKSENKDALKKGFPVPSEEEGGDAPAMEAPPTPEAGMGEEMPPEAGMGEEMGQEAPPEADEEGEMPPEAGMEGEEGLEEEGEGQELSDDELHGIYSSMAPEELERHYMIIRGLLRNEYQKAEMAEKGKKAPEAPCKKNEEPVTSKELADLKKSNDELKKSLENAVKAISIMSAPQRKAITTEIEIVQKSEGASATGSKKDLSKEEIRDEINKKVKESSLTKSERETINGYLLNGGRDEDKGPVLAILEGKK